MAIRALHFLATSALPAITLVVGPTVTQTDKELRSKIYNLADIGLSPSSYAYVPLIATIANIVKLPELLRRPK